MGSFSIWHWLVVLTVVAVPVGAVLIAKRRRRSSDTRAFHDPTTLTRWPTILLYGFFATSMAGFISSLFERHMLDAIQNGAFNSQMALVAATQVSDNRQQALSILYFIMLLTSGISILMWIYRANANARALGATGMEYTPGWSVGWYFVPLFGLWKPFGAMREIWQTSRAPANWRETPVPGALRWWWFFWIASNIMGQVSLKMSQNIHDISDALAANTVNLISSLTDIPLSLILIWIIRNVYRVQMLNYKTQADSSGVTLDGTTEVTQNSASSLA